jgi:hypothetical protein
MAGADHDYVELFRELHSGVWAETPSKAAFILAT